MKYISLYLSNYIGIYNGMGIYEMHIDFTKCRSRTVIIRGDNGSGKSTLMKSLSLFPDTSDNFIPGLPAKKEIILQDNEVFYKLEFVHNIKSNGERDTTKAYITKTFGGQAIQLNENGNVTSFKDILYSELNLDSNFSALSQLSNNDRGLADKKPAERKKFVNSIISSLDVYNNIYKALSKRSNSYKAMISSIIAKLNMIGDEASVQANLDNVELKINSINDSKDKAVVALAQDQSRISLLDPDGSIQQNNSVLSSEIENFTKDKNKCLAIINGMISSNNISNKDPISERNEIINEKNSLITLNQIDKGSIDSLVIQQDAKLGELDSKLRKISSLNNNMMYDTIISEIEECNNTLINIEQIMLKAGVKDMNSINKEEYILALETLRDLGDHISSFKECVDYNTLQKLVEVYTNQGQIIPRNDISMYIKSIDDIKNKLESLNRERSLIESKIGLLDTINLRPKSCNDDSCPFIKDAIEFINSNPKDRIDYIENQIGEYTKDLEIKEKMFIEADSMNDAINRFSIIVREVSKNSIILSKMVNGDIFSDTKVFLENLMNGYNFDYINTIYEYIQLGNQFDIYKSTKALLSKYEADKKDYDSKLLVIDSINNDINEINMVLSNLANRIEPLREATLAREKRIVKLQELEGVYDAIIEQLSIIDELNQKIKDTNEALSINHHNMSDIEMSLMRINENKKAINIFNETLIPLVRQRDNLNHSVQMIKEYLAEKEELEKNYNFIETIKYYSSPTTGIQLVFMELYMGKIISLANELLGLLFQGQYAIQPFIINESEFRIPCLGSGYINDDISSMSSSQIGMISMILSFSLLHNSSTKFNIIKLDEIDGPLDYNNRTSFTDVLNKIMDIMGTEQCIMISHNTELQVDESDVILLKHDIDNTDFLRGNIIWSY